MTWTKANKNWATAYHKRLCLKLNIKPTDLIFSETPCLSNKRVSGSYFIDTNEIILYKKKGVKYTLAHETYHHYQNQKGWLGLWLYKGIPWLYYTDHKPYSQWPWERAAHRFGLKQVNK